EPEDGCEIPFEQFSFENKSGVLSKTTVRRRAQNSSTASRSIIDGNTWDTPCASASRSATTSWVAMYSDPWKRKLNVLMTGSWKGNHQGLSLASYRRILDMAETGITP